MKRRVGVLMGGPSAERDISIRSGKAVYSALLNRDIDAVSIELEMAQDLNGYKEYVTEVIRSLNIDTAFIALHGEFGEDGNIQNILEEMKIPYTGSKIDASRLGMDKIGSKDIFMSNNIPVPRYRVIHRSGLDKGPGSQVYFKELGSPLVVKPSCGGSSIGLSIIGCMEFRNSIQLGEFERVQAPSQGVTAEKCDEKEYFAASEGQSPMKSSEERSDEVTYCMEFQGSLAKAFKYSDDVMIEEYVRGREITVGILEDKALPVVEIVPGKKFFDFEAKYQEGLTEYRVPADIEKAKYIECQGIALSAHKAIGARFFSRVDMILADSGVPVVLEVNTIPGLTEISLLPKAARAAGIDFDKLILKIMESTLW